MIETVPTSNFHYLLHPYNTSLVTCCNNKGEVNIIAVAWLIPLSIQPPLIGMSIRPARYSYNLIQQAGDFVVNVAPYEIAEQVLFCGRRSGRQVDKFEATGLTPAQAHLVRSPIIEECIAHLECCVVNDIETGDHHLVVGEVLAASVRPAVLGKDGLYDLDYIQPLLHLGRNRFSQPVAWSTEPPLPT